MASRCWHLPRNCALTPRQSLAGWSVPIVLLLGVALLAAGHHYWWVTGFAVLNGTGLMAACWHYSRHARDGDTLTLDDSGLLHIEQRRGMRSILVAWPAARVRMTCSAHGAITLRKGSDQLKVGGQAPLALRWQTMQELQGALQPWGAVWQ